MLQTGMTEKERMESTLSPWENCYSIFSSSSQFSPLPDWINTPQAGLMRVAVAAAGAVAVAEADEGS